MECNFSDDCACDWASAKSYVDQEVCIAGPVVDMFSPAEQQRWYSYYPELALEVPPHLFISLGESYPSANRVSLVIWGSNRYRFPADFESQLRAHNVRVTGKLYSYGGVMHMSLTDPAQVEVM